MLAVVVLEPVAAVVAAPPRGDFLLKREAAARRAVAGDTQTGFRKLTSNYCVKSVERESKSTKLPKLANKNGKSILVS